MTRDEAERELAAVVQKALWAQKQRVMKSPDWLWEDWLLAFEIVPMLEMIAMDEAWRRYKELMPNRQLAEIWAAVKEWIKGYSYKFIRDINEFTRSELAMYFQQYMNEGWTLGELEAAVATIFGPDRAMRIAVTETTRAFTEGGRVAADEIQKAGWLMTEIWHTDRDDLVCEQCSPLDGNAVGDGWERSDGPPMHPNCRCWTTFEVA